MRRFRFDYDYENDSLFLYDPKSKSKASIEIDDLIVDFNRDKDVAGIELLNATRFFKDIRIEGSVVTKKMLKDIQQCKVEMIRRDSFIVFKLLILFKHEKRISAPIMLPSIRESSPALMEC